MQQARAELGEAREEAARREGESAHSRHRPNHGRRRQCHYLPRVKRPTVWSWHDLHGALGHERGALAMAVDAYPAARQMGAVEVLPAMEGIRFRPAAPAIRRTAIKGV